MAALTATSPFKAVPAAGPVTHAIIHFDGASRGNPGPMAGGAIVEIEGKQTVVHGRRGHGTNNEAEYEGLIVGLHHALEQGARTVDVRGDSQLVIRQLEGTYSVKAQNLKPLWAEARRLLSLFDTVEFKWVRRADNAAADRAANEALDGLGSATGRT